MAYPSPYFQGHFDFLAYSSVDNFYRQLKAEGFTHIVTKYTNSLADMGKSQNPLVQYMDKYFTLHDELIQKYCRVIYERKGVAVSRRTFSDKNVDVYVRICELR